MSLNNIATELGFTVHDREMLSGIVHNCWVLLFIRKCFSALFIDRNNELFKDIFNIFGTPVCYYEHMKFRILSCDRNSEKRYRKILIRLSWAPYIVFLRQNFWLII